MTIEVATGFNIPEQKEVVGVYDIPVEELLRQFTARLDKLTYDERLATLKQYKAEFVKFTEPQN